MKKLICLLLAVSMLMTVSLALAESAPDVRDVTESPSVAFGSDHVKAPEIFNSTWHVSFSYSDKPEWESRTLADGSEVNIMTFAAVPGSEYQVPMTARLYFVDGKLAAAVEVVNIPEGSDTAGFKENADKVLGTTAAPLDLKKAEHVMELIGEDAHLENGQDAWAYSIYAPTDLNTEGERPVISAVMTMRVEDNTLYVAQFPYGAAAEKNAAAQELTELKGYGELTAEEQNAVQQYAEFLKQQQNETLEQYIDFLLKKHQ